MHELSVDVEEDEGDFSVQAARLQIRSNSHLINNLIQVGHGVPKRQIGPGCGFVLVGFWIEQGIGLVVYLRYNEAGVIFPKISAAGAREVHYE